MLLHIFAMAVNLNAISEIPCQEVTWISKSALGYNLLLRKLKKQNLVADAFGTCGSSLILVLRTRAVWHRDLKITALLGALFLAQIALWIQSEIYFSIFMGCADISYKHSIPLLKGSMESPEKCLRGHFNGSQTNIGLCIRIQLSLPSFQFWQGLISLMKYSDGV
jgi:hypothetical protein